MGSDKAPHVSIIIPIYQRTEWIGRCIAALGKQASHHDFEVVIVDDGSPNQQQVADAVNDSTRDSALSVRFIRKTNAGPAAARNCGAKESHGILICFLDDDSIVGEGWLNGITAPFADETVSVVSGNILSYNRENSFTLLLEKAVYSGIHWATCNIAYRRELFIRLGGFDESFKEASWEDNDLGLRARWAGARQVHNEKALVYHAHEESLEEYRRKCLLNGRGAAAFSRKCCFKRPLWALATPVIISRYLALFLCPSVVMRQTSASYLRFLWSYNSLCGYLSAITGNSRGTNQKG